MWTGTETSISISSTEEWMKSKETIHKEDDPTEPRIVCDLQCKVLHLHKDLADALHHLLRAGNPRLRLLLQLVLYHACTSFLSRRHLLRRCQALLRGTTHWDISIEVLQNPQPATPPADTHRDCRSLFDPALRPPVDHREAGAITREDVRRWRGQWGWWLWREEQKPTQNSKKWARSAQKSPRWSFYKDKITCGPHRQRFFNSRALDKIWWSSGAVKSAWIDAERARRTMDRPR